MLVVIRNPLGVALAALLSLAMVVYALSTLDDKADRVRDGNRRVREIRASSAPLLASDLAGFQERRRREGLRDAEPLEAWIAQFSDHARTDMRDWLDYHSVRTGGLSGGFYVETSSGPGTDGWFRVEVDRAAGRISLTCGGDPAPGCASGRWSLEEYGHSAAFLLGR